MSIVTQTTTTTTTQATATAGTAAGEPWLNYSFNTVPNPVTITPPPSDDGNPPPVSHADLVITTSRHWDGNVKIRKVTALIPVGEASSDLVLDITRIEPKISTPGWNPSTNASAQSITFTGPEATIDYNQGMSIQLNEMPINRQVGSAPVYLQVEYYDSQFSKWETQTTKLDIGKFPPGFYLRNLLADPAVVENDGTVTLTWERSEGPTYHLLYEDQRIDVTTYTRYDVPNVRRSTMYYVEGVVGNAKHILNTYVTVNKPDMEVGNLTVHGQCALAHVKPTAVAKIGAPWVDPEEVEAILDGNRETYYLSTHELWGNDKVEVNLGPDPQLIKTVDIYLGDLNGDFLGPESWTLRYWKKEGSSAWYWATLGNYPRGREIHYSGATGVQTTALQLLGHHRGGGRLAIRSFEVGPPLSEAALITGRSALFRVPVTMLGGTSPQTPSHTDSEHPTTDSGTDGTAPSAEPSPSD